MNRFVFPACCVAALVFFFWVVSIDGLSRGEGAKAFAARMQISQFRQALDMYREDIGDYPSTEEGLDALRQNPNASAAWKGPYLQTGVPADPWGRPYRYVYESAGRPNVTSLPAPAR